MRDVQREKTEQVMPKLDEAEADAEEADSDSDELANGGAAAGEAGISVTAVAKLKVKAGAAVGRTSSRIDQKSSLLADLRQNSLGTRASLGERGSLGGSAGVPTALAEVRASLGERRPLMNRNLQAHGQQRGSLRGSVLRGSKGRSGPPSPRGGGDGFADPVAKALMELEEEYLAARAHILGYGPLVGGDAAGVSVGDGEAAAAPSESGAE